MPIFYPDILDQGTKVFPGDTITADLWTDGNVISFEARVKERGVTVIKSGKTVLRS